MSAPDLQTVEPFDIGRSCGGEALLFKPGASHDFAIIRDPADAPLLAAAPVLLHAAKEFIAELDSSGDFANWQRVKRQLRDAVRAAEEESA